MNPTVKIILNYIGSGTLLSLALLALHQYKAGVIREARISDLEHRMATVEAVAAKSHEDDIRFDEVFLLNGFYPRPTTRHNEP